MYQLYIAGFQFSTNSP